MILMLTYCDYLLFQRSKLDIGLRLMLSCTVLLFFKHWCRCRSLKFMVGPTEAPKFRMIERHYFRGTLVKSYDFEFGFCIPGSTNTWDAEYEMPPLDDALGKLRC